MVAARARTFVKRHIQTKISAVIALTMMLSSSLAGLPVARVAAAPLGPDGIITSPTHMAPVSGTIAVNITTNDTDLKDYRVRIQNSDGNTVHTTGWVPQTTPLTDQTVTSFDTTPKFDGTYTIELRVRDVDNLWIEHEITVQFSNGDPIINIDSPTEGSTVSGVVSVVGDLSDPNLDLTQYRIRIRNNATNAQVFNTGWLNVSGSTTVVDGVLATWNTLTTADANYRIVMQARDSSGRKARDRVLDVTVLNLPNVPAGLTWSDQRGGTVSQGPLVPCGSVINYREVGFDWDLPTDADFDHWEVRTTGDDSSIITLPSSFSSLLPVLTGMLPDEDRTWSGQLRAVDTAGNFSAWTAPCTLTLDRVAPVGTVNGISTADITPDLGGTHNLDPHLANISVKVLSGTTELVVDDAIINSDGTWTLPAPYPSFLAPLGFGTYTVKATFTDTAGNSSTAEGTLIVQAPVSPPASPGASISTSNVGGGGAVALGATSFIGNAASAGAAAVAGSLTTEPSPDTSNNNPSTTPSNGEVLAANDASGCFVLLGACWYWWAGGAGILGLLWFVYKRQDGTDASNA